MFDPEVSPERGSAPTTDLEAVTAALHEGEHVPSVVQSAPGGSSEKESDGAGSGAGEIEMETSLEAPYSHGVPAPSLFFRFDSLHDKFGLGLWPEPGEKHPWER